MKSKFGVILDEIVFFLKIIFLIKREIRMIKHLLLMSHSLPYYCLKFTFARLLTDCLMYPAENDDISKRINTFSKLML